MATTVDAFRSTVPRVEAGRAGLKWPRPLMTVQRAVSPGNYVLLQVMNPRFPLSDHFDGQRLFNPGPGTRPRAGSASAAMAVARGTLRHGRPDVSDPGFRPPPARCPTRQRCTTFIDHASFPDPVARRCRADRSDFSDRCSPVPGPARNGRGRRVSRWRTCRGRMSCWSRTTTTTTWICRALRALQVALCAAVHHDARAMAGRSGDWGLRRPNWTGGRTPAGRGAAHHRDAGAAFLGAHAVRP